MTRDDEALAEGPVDEAYVNDASILEDGFGSTIAGDQVARMALEAMTPFTIGITGKWGSGKTSVLRRAFATLGGKPISQEVPLGKVRADTGRDDWKRWACSDDQRQKDLGWEDELLRKAERSLCVWYSPWQHQTAENPLIPLLLEIRAQFTTRIKVRETLANVNRRGGLAGLALIERVVDAAAGLALGRNVKFAGGTSEAVRKAWREAAPAEPTLGDGQRFHLLFEDAVESLLGALPRPKGRRKAAGDGESQGRLIVFIDDLDRCEESAVVELLESIKLYLGSKGCVFVLALDENAVLSALERHWQGRSEDANREYLEKLFQAVVPVPLPRAPAVRTFLEQRLRRHGFPKPEQLAKLIEDLLEPNPRKIKNFVNGACASWGLFRGAPEAGELKFAQRFLLFHYLRTQHKPVWRLLERQPWSLMILSKVLTGGADQTLELPPGVDPDEQGILEALLFRAFAHVLKADTFEPGFHRHIPIAEAVELFQQRIDRKRSDEHFIRWYRKLITPEMDLPDEFLYLPENPRE
ncbi:MAG: hypothetical protein GY856_19090 [bacterium]|nr:hypothetical protein [bacterium]